MRYIVAAFVVAGLPFVVPNPFYLHMAQDIAMLAIAAIGLNILLGMSGQLSLGQAGFLALGGYGSGILATKYGWPLLLSIPVGLLVATAAGVLIGLVALRARTHYLAMATLAFGLIVEIVAQRWVGLTGGSMGLIGVPQLDFGDFANGATYFFWAVAGTLLVVQMFNDWLMQSKPRPRPTRHPRERRLRADGRHQPGALAGRHLRAGSAAGRHRGHLLRPPVRLCQQRRLRARTQHHAADRRCHRRPRPGLWPAGRGLHRNPAEPVHRRPLRLRAVHLRRHPARHHAVLPGRRGWRLRTRCIAPAQVAAPRGRSAGRRAPAAGPFRLAPARAHTGPVLELHGVSKSYAGVLAVDSLSMTVQHGTIHALIGPNGAGKSTVINIVAGLYWAEGGTIRFLGRDVTGMPAWQRARLGIARTFQNLQLISNLTVVENVMLALRGRQGNVAQDFLRWLSMRNAESGEREEAMELLRFLGIARFADTLPGGLSYGHRKLCELARALAQRPVLMLLDEPIAGPERGGGSRDRRRGPPAARPRHHSADRRAQHGLRDERQRRRHGPRLWQAHRRGRAGRGSARQPRHRCLSRHGAGGMIEARDVSVRIGEIEILHGVDLDVPSGSIVTVVGANGAGKTTLLRVLSRLLPLRSGSIRFDGQTVDATPPHRLAQQGLVQVPQGRQIIPGLSVEDNLLIGARRVPDLDDAETARLLKQEYERFPVLRQRRGVAGGSLSGGEQQMLALSRALMMRPKLLMLDEPSLGLAPQIVRAILQALQDLSRAGMTVLLVEQAAFTALKIATYGYVLQNGRVVLSGPTADLLKDRRLVERYLG